MAPMISGSLMQWQAPADCSSSSLSITRYGLLPHSGSQQCCPQTLECGQSLGINMYSVGLLSPTSAGLPWPLQGYILLNFQRLALSWENNIL